MPEFDIDRVKALIQKREEIDQELQSIFTGSRERKPQQCSICQSTEHSARKCPQKPQA